MRVAAAEFSVFLFNPGIPIVDVAPDESEEDEDNPGGAVVVVVVDVVVGLEVEKSRLPMRPSSPSAASCASPLLISCSSLLVEIVVW